MVPAAVAALCFYAGPAFSQTPAAVTVVSGNGQLITSPTGYFQPITVEVTDATGNPISGATVTWTVSGSGSLAYSQTTTTDQNGITSNQLISYGVSSNGLPYVQTMVQATAGSGVATFYLTQAFPLAGGVAPITIVQLSQTPGGVPAQYIGYGTVLQGPAGSTSPSPIVLHAFATETSAPIPNIAVNIFNLQTAAAGPTVQCASGSGAGNATVLTDYTGTAICNLVYGGIPNVAGSADVNIGALFSTTPPISPPYYSQYGPLQVSVTPGVPGMLKVISGTPQTAQAGQALATPLAFQVLDASGQYPIAGVTVNWAVSPAGAATLGSGASTTTDGNGNTSNTATLSNSANGTVQITATVAGTTLGVPFVITAIPNITATGLSIVSGNNQSAIEGSKFGAPLVVQLNGTNGNGTTVPITGATVQFSISGPGTLSSTSGTTGSTGQASVNVTAGSTAGTVTVTATADGFSQAFTLTVNPPGPQLTASSFLNGADFQVGSISPCSIATIMAAGLAPGLQTIVSGANLVGPLPYTLAGEGVTVNGGQAPIYNVGTNLAGQQQLTFQVPCDATPGSSVPIKVTTTGGGSGTINVALEAASPGIFQTVMTDGVSRAAIVRPDGSWVSLTNPARRGEMEIAFATGLGPSIPSVGTDNLPAPGVTATPQYTVIVGMAAQGIPGGTFALSPDLVGVWEVPFTIPASIASTNYPACGAGNCVTFSISVIPSGSSTPISSGTTTIPVQ